VAPKTSGMGLLMMRIGGLFVPQAREMVEMMGQFTRPFVVDSRRIQRDLGVMPTPLEEGMARTVAWYRERAAWAAAHQPCRQVIDAGVMPEA
jgi:nucleoside-diphosphate-sugar epimerase